MQFWQREQFKTDWLRTPKETDVRRRHVLFANYTKLDIVYA